MLKTEIYSRQRGNSREPFRDLFGAQQRFSSTHGGPNTPSVSLVNEFPGVACIEKLVFQNDLIRYLLPSSELIERIESERAKVRVRFGVRRHLTADDGLQSGFLTVDRDDEHLLARLQARRLQGLDCA